MAYTKILVIHNRLDKCVGYTQDPEKTSLEAAIDYALDREKTEQTCFETAVNCDRESVYADMMDTKRRWGKEGRNPDGDRTNHHTPAGAAPGLEAMRPHRGRHPQGPGGGGSPAPRPCKEASL